MTQVITETPAATTTEATEPTTTEETTTTETTKTKKEKRTWTPMSTEVAKAVLATARPALAPCLCGCGETTKGRFFPGHDATLKETLKATVTNGTPAAKRVATEALAAFGW